MSEVLRQELESLLEEIRAATENAVDLRWTAETKQLAVDVAKDLATLQAKVIAGEHVADELAHSKAAATNLTATIGVDAFAIVSTLIGRVAGRIGARLFADALTASPSPGAGSSIIEP